MPRKPPEFSDASLLASIRRHPQSIADLCARYGVPERRVLAAIRRLERSGHLIVQRSGKWGAEKSPDPSTNVEHTFSSDSAGRYRFGFTSDQHLCSKYERLDVLNELYDLFAKAGLRRVYNAGNWIDGEARFNTHDLLVHGMDAQLAYLSEHYPARPGIKTYAIAGEDHEGWYGRREGVDIGRHAADAMRAAGRRDWVNLGFMESFVNLVHSGTGASAAMLVMHPGGGSSYAVSYRPQKIVESLSGGEKPALLLIGHYHKLSYNVFRNVHCIQSGCTQDQSIFMRKKSIEAHVGGGICELEQDPRTGALTTCRVTFFNRFNRGFYNRRWSQSGPVVLAKRGV